MSSKTMVGQAPRNFRVVFLAFVVVTAAMLTTGLSMPEARISSSRFAEEWRAKAVDKLAHSLRLGTLGDTCEPCSGNDPLCKKWGRQAILRSRGYIGSGRNFAPLASKLSRGNVSVGILGGSVSSCHDVEMSECYPTLLAQRLEHHFGHNITLHNGAVGASGSEIFASCWDIRVPDNLDLVILEFSINDYHIVNEDFTRLIRALLSLPKPPAIMILDLYSPYIDGWYRGTQGIAPLAPFYDIPLISQKNVLYHHRHLYTEVTNNTQWWTTGLGNVFPAGHHPSPHGHELITDLLLSYILEQDCESRTPHSSHDHAGDSGIDFPGVPEWLPWESLADVGKTPKYEKPVCQSADAGPHQMVMASGSSPLKLDAWKGKAFIRMEKVGEKLVLEHISNRGYITLFFWRSRSLGFGVAFCWLNDDRAHGKYLDGYWSYDFTMPARVDFPVNATEVGTKQVVTCENMQPPRRSPWVKEGTEIRINAIVW